MEMDYLRAVVILFILYAVIRENFALAGNNEGSEHQIRTSPLITYLRDFLLALRNKAVPVDLNHVSSSTSHGKAQGRKRNKRGSRGGVRNRLRSRGNRHPLPIITLSNVRSLNNKLDEITTRLRFDEDFRG